MAKKTKKELCKWGKKTYEKNLDSLAPLVLDPRFYCTTCGRVSKFKKYLCDAKKLPEKSEDPA